MDAAAPGGGAVGGVNAFIAQQQLPLWRVVDGLLKQVQVPDAKPAFSSAMPQSCSSRLKSVRIVVLAGTLQVGMELTVSDANPRVLSAEGSIHENTPENAPG